MGIGWSEVRFENGASSIHQRLLDAKLRIHAADRRDQFICRRQDVQEGLRPQIHELVAQHEQ
jgi:hypothetical protein